MMTVLALMVALVLTIQYGACVALFQANERRTMVELIEKSARIRTALTVSAWCLLIISIFLCAKLQGWERGVPLWLCMIAVTGFISLYVSSYKPAHHVKSGLVALIASLIMAVLLSGSFLFIDGSQETQQQATQRSAI